MDLFKNNYYKIFIVLFILFHGAEVRSQTLKVNTQVKVGYSFNQPTGNEYALFMSSFDHSPSVSVGLATDYKPFKKIIFSSGLLLSRERLKYSYSDINKIDNAIIGEPDYFELINSRIYETQYIDGFTIPADFRFCVSKKIFLTAGLSLKYILSKQIFNDLEVNSNIGIGRSGAKMGWVLYLEKPFQNRKLKPEENRFTRNNPNIGIEYISRSINFALSWNLWSNQ